MNEKDFAQYLAREKGSINGTWGDLLQESQVTRVNF